MLLACGYTAAALEMVYRSHLEVVSQVNYRLVCLSAFFQPEHHQLGAFVNILLGFQDVRQRVHVADDSSSFAVGLVVGLGEGAKLSVQSVTCLSEVCPREGGDLLFVLAEILPHAVSMALHLAKYSGFSPDCSTRDRNQSCPKHFVSYKSV